MIFRTDVFETVKTWIEKAKLAASDGTTNDYFGMNVSISDDGNTIAVGAYDDDVGATNTGSAYVFVRSGNSWVEQAKLVASDRAASNYFGYSVALSSDGNTLVVGAQGSDTGAAYVFTRSGSTWTEQTKLTPSDGASGDEFGYSVSISPDGNTIAVGADKKCAVYVFTWNGSSWVEQAKLTASDGAANDYFGYAVSLSGDGGTLAVGSKFANLPGKTDAGAVYVFTRSGSTWTQQAKLTASDAAGNDQFGTSVAVSADGNYLAVGAYRDDGSVGSTYVFTRSGSTWTQQAKLTASDGASGDYFGVYVDLSSSGDTLIVGAHAADPSDISNAGAVYVFTRSGSTWIEEAKLTASDKASGDYFGVSVGISADGATSVVGAHSVRIGGTKTGAAYVYQLQ